MTTSSDPRLTLLLPQYKTLELTKLCLRVIRKTLDLNKIKVIVIDNDSKDTSLEYLRTVPWITLIERTAVPGEKPAEAHTRALDMGLEITDTEFVMSMHTDTFFLDSGALSLLLDPFEDPAVAGTGSWKLEYISPLKQFGKWLENLFRNYIKSPLCGKGFGSHAKFHKDHWFLRSHCAVYRTKLLKEMNLSFGDGATAGKVIHQKLEQAGFKMLFIPSDTLMKHMIHLDPAARRQLQKALNKMHYREILDSPMEDC